MKKKKLSPYEAYYLRQVQGAIPHYHFQRGHGLGNIFAGLIRRAAPLVSFLGKRALTVGKRVFKDAIMGHNLKTAAKRHLLDEGASIARDVIKKKIPRKYIEKIKNVLPEYTSPADTDEEDIFKTPPG